MIRPNRRLLLALTGLALASRLAWALWIHPPGDYVFRDMEGYMYSARHVVEHGFAAHRYLAFQAWGTHALLVAPLARISHDRRAALSAGSPRLSRRSVRLAAASGVRRSREQEQPHLAGARSRWKGPHSLFRGFPST